LFSSWCVCIFFFQAEDGIRDFHVTGVQTCALPICDAGAVGRELIGRDFEVVGCGLVGKHAAGEVEGGAVTGTEKAALPIRGEARSEERRVGKECRSRWWPDE